MTIQQEFAMSKFASAADREAAMVAEIERQRGYIERLEEKMAQHGEPECPQCGSFDIKPCSLDANGEACADVCVACGRGF